MFEKVKNQDHLLGKTNRIVDGTTIIGNITTQADFRLDGKLTGNFTSEGKIVPRRVSGISSKQQRFITKAIKNARMVGLLPFIHKEQ